MIEAKDIPEAIQWHEGMLLTPQHFQQLAIRNEALLHYHVQTASPWHWGIRRLRIDPVLLIDGIFRVLELEAVLPDGLLVVHHHDLEHALEFSLAGRGEELRGKPGMIHLAVPASRPGNALGGALPRYASVEGAPVTDENTGDSELIIPRLRPRFTLLLTDNPPAKYRAFPLAGIAYRNETFTLTDHIPPTLRVAPRTELWDLCAVVARRIREKAVFLSDRITSPATPVKGPKALETRLLLHMLVSGLPTFEALLNTGASHPFPLYLALCGLVGNMAGIGTDHIPPVLATYDHNHPRKNFEQAREYIFRMIDEGIRESHIGIPFDFNNGAFSIRMRPEWMEDPLVVGIQRRPGTSDHDMVEWMEACLIGVEAAVESMRERRILGARRQRVDGDGELVPATGTLLFHVSVEPAFIRADETLRVFNASDPAARRGPLEIVLYVRNKPLASKGSEEEGA